MNSPCEHSDPSFCNRANMEARRDRFVKTSTEGETTSNIVARHPQANKTSGRGLSWSPSHDSILTNVVAKYGEQDWETLAIEFNKYFISNPNFMRTGVALYSRWRKRVRESSLAKLGRNATAPKVTHHGNTDPQIDQATSVYQVSHSGSALSKRMNDAEDKITTNRKSKAPAIYQQKISKGKIGSHSFTDGLNTAMPTIIDWFQCQSCNSYCLIDSMPDGIPPIKCEQCIKMQNDQTLAESVHGRKRMRLYNAALHGGIECSDFDKDFSKPLRASVYDRTETSYSTDVSGREEARSKKPQAIYTLPEWALPRSKWNPKKVKATPFHCAPAIAFTRSIIDGSLDHGRRKAQYVLHADSVDLTKCDHVGFCNGCGKCRKTT